MKTATKISTLITAFLVTGLIGLFNFFYASKVSKFLDFLAKIAKEENAVFNYSKIYIAVYILSSILLFIAVISFLFNNFYDFKFKKTLQTILLYINLVLMITSIILLLVVYLKNYELLDFYSINYIIDEESSFEFLFYVDLFLLLTFQCVGNITLSGIGLKYIKDEEINNIETKDDIEVLSPKTQLEKEIQELKDSIEIEKLKNEYKTLYKQLQDNKNEDKK